MDDKAERRSNPADAPRPLPLNNIRSPSVENEMPLRRDPPTRSGDQAVAKAAAEVAAKARGMIERGYGQNEDERVVLRKMFAEARALRIAAYGEAVVLAQEGNDLTA